MARRCTPLAGLLLVCLFPGASPSAPIGVVGSPDDSEAAPQASGGSERLTTGGDVPDIRPFFAPPQTGDPLPPPLVEPPPPLPAGAPVVPGVASPATPEAAGDRAKRRAPIRVAIDIDPGAAKPARIDPHGAVPVAVLGSPRFDVTRIDSATLVFGPDRAKSVEAAATGRDLNGDGHADLIARFPAEETGIGLRHTRACLAGATREGAPFKGCADVRPTLR